MKIRKILLSTLIITVLLTALCACSHTHEYGEWTVKVPATCTEKGEEVRTCACGETETREITLNSHKYGEWAVKNPATCTNAATEERVCSVCGATEQRVGAAATGHSFGEWTVSVPATSTQKGEEVRVCACGEKETREIAAIENQLEAPTVSYANGSLTWNEVKGAEGYALYVNDAFDKNLGDVLSYRVPATEGTVSYQVVALTRKAGYKPESPRSEKVLVETFFGKNSTFVGDFQLFNSETALNRGGNWVAVGGQNVIFVEASSTSSSIIMDGENAIYKAYNPYKPCIEFNIFANGSFTEAGTYRVSMRVKLGQGAKNVNNIGFRFFGAPETPVAGDYEFDVTEINADGWTTVYTDVTVDSPKTCDWINMFFWVFTHDDESHAEDNYVLIDDIQIRKFESEQTACNHLNMSKVDAKERTCEEDGNIEYYHCEDCGKIFLDEGGNKEISVEDTVVPKHSFGLWMAAADGTEVRTCVLGCGTTQTRKVLEAPVISLDGHTVSWTEVEGATGYTLYRGMSPYANLGNTLSYTLPDKEGEYSVRAYTDMAGYSPEGRKSNTAEVKYGDNLLAFGSFQQFVNLPNYWKYNAGNFGNKKILSVPDGENWVMKLQPTQAGTDPILTMAVGNTTVAPGMKIAVLFDVKKGAEADGEVFVGICNAGVWEFGNVTVNVPAADGTGWSHVHFEFTYPETTVAGPWANFDLGYRSATVSENDYVLIDNFRIVKVEGETETRVDTNIFGDFEAFGTEAALAVNNTWYSSVLVEGGHVENEIIVEGENAMMKLTDTNTPDAVFTVAAGGCMPVIGTYKVSMRVKLGPDMTNANLGNIGFHLYGVPSPLAGVHNDFARNGGISWNLSQDGWATVSTYITTNAVSADWINIQVYAFTNNETAKRDGAYIIVDDITVRLQETVLN